ncbi:undecaprenyl-phosphate glucose phosphotransferase [Pontibacter virosus]|uniref:Putative colanic acid biosynthesis UDP-glucose lipid carrier transferase n=1 Tax=Pontibacter virosus TaxID=1765052 RepID=A0A2U1AQM9_9BACT|nr:undecaprenyl-phosphate glucose phosphotransferase [Pontibacter virosus]PVY38695.1 putative colanic acid biosynthesis UDP-glucose lipid carrier transferase [Pontibacter virosus]
MSHKYSTLFSWINVTLDYFIINGTLYLSFIISERSFAWGEVYDYKLTLLLLNFCWFYCSHVFNIYSQILKREAVPIMRANVGALCLFMILAILIKFILPQLYIPPTPFIYYFILLPILILSLRFAFLLLRKYRRKSWLGSNNIAIVGASLAGKDLYNYITINNQLDYNVVGIFDDNPSNVPPHINYLGKIDDCISYAESNGISEIYCALPYNQSNKIESLMQEADAHMILFRLVPDLKGTIHHNFLVELFGYVPILKLRQEPLESKANEILKRGFDIFFSLLVIVLILSWLIPLMALIIKLESKGPVFFKQQRSGKRNKVFYCLKFRSMKVNLDCDTLQTCKGDQRITRVGKFIRKTSIDELPQFINVFMGDMSVVGPRPHMLKHTQDYSKVIDNYMVRHFLTPGITGWAQVNGYRGETKETIAMLNRVQADLWYLEHWSILLDLKIIFLTIWQGFRYNDKAY